MNRVIKSFEESQRESEYLDTHFKISVDGGINNETIKYVDVDIAVSGSYVCMSNDFEEAILNLRGY